MIKFEQISFEVTKTEVFFKKQKVGVGWGVDKLIQGLGKPRLIL